jgi:2-desacetyl-2-hydroxyethyl bacteriochlorophyllide A dehydrogenase
MKAVIFPKIKKFEIKDIETPEINDKEVLIKNSYAGFCGTDFKIFNGDYVAKYPLIPGHEFSGIVEKVGKDVKGIKQGQRVAIEHTITCGNCYYCKRNEQNLCINRGSYGTTANGGFAEYSKVTENCIHILNDRVSLKEAALQEPLGCGILGLERINIRYGDKALIFGIGPIGLILLQLLNIRGVSSITMVDVHKDKIEIGKKFGASHVLINDKDINEKLKSISEYGFDIVIDATGIAKVCEQLFGYVNKNSRILFFGHCEHDEKISISPYQIHKNDLSIYGSFSLKRNTAQALELLANKKINLEGIISHEFKLTDFAEAFELAKTGKFTKIMFKCSND